MHRDKNAALSLFALEASRPFGEKIGLELGIELSEHEERAFEDGEHKIRPLESVRGRDVFVTHSLYSDHQESVNDKLCRLLFFIGALNDADAARVTALVPYLCYSRKDQKTKPYDPVTTRYIAGLFEAAGAAQVVSLDVHNTAAFQNAFRCRTENIVPHALFVDYLAPLLGDEEAVVVSPDLGGIKRAERFRELLSASLGRTVPAAFLEKYRSLGVLSGETVVGDLEGRTVIIIDDMIGTGRTIERAIQAGKDLGAQKIYAAASHGLFVGDAGRILADDALTRIVITDSIPPFRLDAALIREKVEILSAAGLFAQTVQQIHSGSIR